MVREQKKFANSKEKRCPFCDALNPPTAFACISCYKVMKDKYKVPFWQIQIRMSAVIVILGFILYVTGTVFMKGYGRAKEAEATVQSHNAKYQESLTKMRILRDKESSKNEEPVKEHSIEELKASMSN